MKLKMLLGSFFLLFPVFLTGCWSSHEVNTLAITVCIGIDKIENGYRVTEQVINPKAIASKRSINESPIILYTSEGQSIGEIIQSLTTQSSRRIYHSHLRMVIFGEEVARDGIKDILDYFMREREYRTDFYFAVAKGASAKEVLSVLTPLEAIPGISMYSSLETSQNFWAPTKSIKIIELINLITAEGKNLVLPSIEISAGTAMPNSTEVLNKDTGIKKPIFTGLGVFRKDKLVGWLNEDESKGYNYITGNVKKTVGTIYYGNNDRITIDVMKVKSDMEVYRVNDKPAIAVNIDMLGTIKTAVGTLDVSKEENQSLLNKLSEDRVTYFCNKAITTVRTEFKTDIFGFGEAIHKKYPELWGTIKDNWNDDFVDLPVNITVKSKVTQLGQITTPLFGEEKE
ncbi:MAG: putative spore germination protein [Firmicutes bacterium]|nr:putative spore germination protein [Bacillota bacterium]